MASGNIDYVAIQKWQEAEAKRFDALEIGWANGIYRPFRQTHSEHRCVTSHCPRNYAAYHSVHGYVVPGSETSDADGLSAVLNRLNEVYRRG